MRTKKPVSRAAQKMRNLKLVEDFDRAVTELTLKYLKEGGNAGLAHHTLITNAMQMAFGAGKPAYLAVVATALGAILVETEKRVPSIYFEGNKNVH